MELFKTNRIRLEQMSQDSVAYLQKIYKQSRNLFSSASPWGQILNVVNRLGQLMLYYIEDSITELNINTATRPNSIYGLSRLTGHNPTRAISSSGDVYLFPKESNALVSGGVVSIPNFCKVVCKDNGLVYMLLHSQDDMKVSVLDKNVRILKLVQGELESQTFTGTGTTLQSFEVVLPVSKMVDNFLVNVFVNESRWKKYDFFYDMPRDTPGFLCKTAIGAGGSGVDIYFGNGYQGRIPEFGSRIRVEYLISSGEMGNILETEGVVFEFQDAGMDVEGNEIDLNQMFEIRVASPINFGSNPEPTFLTRLISPYQSRSMVLSNRENFITFFEKFQYFSYVDAFTDYDANNLSLDNIIYLILIPDLQKRIRAGENYFSTPFEFFYLSDLEKLKILSLLEESGQKMVASVIKFIEPTFKKYVLNISLTVWEGYNKDNLREEIISRVSSFLMTFKRKDHLPKSDILALIENIEGVDSVNLFFVSQNIEEEIRNLVVEENLDYSKTGLLATEKEDLRTFLKTHSSLDDRIKYVMSLSKFQAFVTRHIDTFGDVVISSGEIPVIRGGWKDRYGNLYEDSPSQISLGSINLSITKTVARDLNTTLTKSQKLTIKNQ